MSVLTESPTSSDHCSLKRDKNRQKKNSSSAECREVESGSGGKQEVVRGVKWWGGGQY